MIEWDNFLRVKWLPEIVFFRLYELNSYANFRLTVALLDVVVLHLHYAQFSSKLLAAGVLLSSLEELCPGREDLFTEFFEGVEETLQSVYKARDWVRNFSLTLEPPGLN